MTSTLDKYFTGIDPKTQQTHYVICSGDCCTYKVIIHKKEENAKKQKVEILDLKDGSKLVKKYRATEIFIPGEGNLKGETILLRISQDTYVFIGMIIYEFKPLAPIVKYDFDMFSKYFSSPYAVDSNGNYYILIWFCILLNRKGGLTELIKPEHPNCPGLILYQARYISMPPSDEKSIVKLWKKLDGSDVKFFYSKGKRAELVYNLVPRETYEKNSPCYVIKKNGERWNITADDMVQIMSSFGEKVGIKSMKCDMIRTWQDDLDSSGLDV